MAASDQGGHSRIYREVGGSSGATALVVASGGVVRLGAGGQLDASAGAIVLPGSLGRGYISLTPVGVKTTATASGIVPITATSVQPKLVNLDITSGYLGYSWTSAAGSLNPLYFAPVRVPADLATAGGLSVHVVATAQAANATNALIVNMRAGTATAALGTTHALTAAPAETTQTVASGSVPATGFMSFSAIPDNHASGTLTLLAAGISYQKRTS